MSDELWEWQHEVTGPPFDECWAQMYQQHLDLAALSTQGEHLGVMMQAMSNATSIHDRIMRAQLTQYNGELDRSRWLMSRCQSERQLPGWPTVIAGCAGYEITTEGDAFVLVGTTAADSFWACMCGVRFDNSWCCLAGFP